MASKPISGTQESSARNAPAADISEEMRLRIQSRLEALDMTSANAALMAGLQKNFIYDFLAGKKDAVASSALVPIARQLECDVEYLLGTQDEPHRITATPLPFIGKIEAGAWRVRSMTKQDNTHIPLFADDRYSTYEQGLMTVVDRSAEPFAVEGAAVHVLKWDGKSLADLLAKQQNKLVVVTEIRGGLCHTTLREARFGETTIQLSPLSDVDDMKTIEVPNDGKASHKIGDLTVEVFAVAIAAYREFR